jgi:hypothetical protein
MIFRWLRYRGLEPHNPANQNQLLCEYSTTTEQMLPPLGGIVIDARQHRDHPLDRLGQSKGALYEFLLQPTATRPEGGIGDDSVEGWMAKAVERRQEIDAIGDIGGRNLVAEFLQRPNHHAAATGGLPDTVDRCWQVRTERGRDPRRRFVQVERLPSVFRVSLTHEILSGDAVSAATRASVVAWLADDVANSVSAKSRTPPVAGTRYTASPRLRR